MKSPYRRLASTSAVALLVASAALFSATAFAAETMKSTAQMPTVPSTSQMSGTQSTAPATTMKQQAATTMTTEQPATPTPAAKPAKVAKAKPVMHHPVPSAQVREVQQALVDRGLGIKVDGLMGPETRGALKYYQAENHLTVTGRIDPETLSSLKLG